MDICQHSHILCQQRQVGEAEAWFPKRLISFADCDENVKLIDTGITAPAGPYVTLSHCWGDTGDILRTTELTLPDFMREIPAELLPKTFTHAITAARKLGVRYIWIDSLCIIQANADGSPSLVHQEDWAMQSALMHKIYGRALCNLAATASSNCQEGLFRDRPELHPGIWVKGMDGVWLAEANSYEDEVANSPLLRVSLSPHDSDLIVLTTVAGMGTTRKGSLSSPHSLCPKPNILGVWRVGRFRSLSRRDSRHYDIGQRTTWFLQRCVRSST